MMRRLCTSAAATVLFSTATMFGAAPLQAAEEVTITGTLANGWSPKSVTVPTGTTVTWKNGEAIPPLTTGPTGRIAVVHHLTSADGTLDEQLAPGQSVTKTFNEPVVLSFKCDLHPQLMSGGTLTVEGEPVVPPATEKTIEIVEPSGETSSWGFDPDELTVQTGTTITWRNTGDAVHTVTADDGSFDSGNIAPGDTWKRTFDRSIAITYKCAPHPWMTATLVVAKPGEKPPVVVPKPEPKPDNGSQPKPPAVVDSSDRDSNEPMTFDAQIVEGSISDPDSWTYAPETLTVREGDTVRWTNEGSIQHTVTGGVLDSGMMDPGGVFSYTFDTLGTITFACVPHPWMTGAVQVVAVSASTIDLPDAPAVPEPAVPAPGGSGGETPGGGGEGEPQGVIGAEGDDAWSLGHVPLAAGTSAALLTIGFLFVLPLAHELRKQATTKQAGDEQTEADDTTEPVVPELIDPEPVVLPAAPRVRARATAGRTVSAAKAPAKKAPAKKPATAKATLEQAPATKRKAAPRATASGKPAANRIVLDEETPKRTRSKDLAGTRTR